MLCRRLSGRRDDDFWDFEFWLFNMACMMAHKSIFRVGFLLKAYCGIAAGRHGVVIPKKCGFLPAGERKCVVASAPGLYHVCFSKNCSNGVSSELLLKNWGLYYIILL